MSGKYVVSCACTGQEQVIATIDDGRPDGGITVLPFREFTKDGYAKVNRHGGSTQYHLRCECGALPALTDQTIGHIVDRIQAGAAASGLNLRVAPVRRWESWVEPELSDADREERKRYRLSMIDAQLSGTEPPPTNPRWDLEATFVTEDRYIVDLPLLNKINSNISKYRN
jgi:hypothetical protein